MASPSRHLRWVAALSIAAPCPPYLPASAPSVLERDGLVRSGEGVWVERQLHSMGTRLTLGLQAPDRATGLKQSEVAVRALDRVAQRLSTWSEDSELARLNRQAPGEALALSEELCDDLLHAQALWRETSGCFDPGVGSLVHAYDLRGEGRWPTDEQRAQALLASGLRHLVLANRQAQRSHPGFVIEEGAFGKGLGLQRAGEDLLAAGVGEARLDLGGQLLLLGSGRHAVQVAHPDHRERVVLELRLPAGSVATSGNSERGLRIQGRKVGHLLDPRTGLPCDDFGSVTVFSTDATRADAFSTALYVLGPDQGLQLAAARDDVEALYLTRTPSGSLQASATPALHPHLEVLQSGLELAPPRLAANSEALPPR